MIRLYTLAFPCSSLTVPCFQLYIYISEGDNGRGVAVVSSLVSLDREQQKEYLLPILISDSGKPAMVGTSTLTVTVGDVNDNTMTSGSCQITVYKLEVRTV